VKGEGQKDGNGTKGEKKRTHPCLEKTKGRGGVRGRERTRGQTSPEDRAVGKLRNPDGVG